MTTIFTKADIETMYFTIEKVGSNFDEKQLQSKLDVLKARGFYIVDISLVSSHVGSTFNTNAYLIRYVKPKYEVKVDRKTWDDLACEWWSLGAKTEKVFDTLGEAEVYKEEIKSEGVIVDIISHNPLDLPL